MLRAWEPGLATYQGFLRSYGFGMWAMAIHALNGPFRAVVVGRQFPGLRPGLTEPAFQAGKPTTNRVANKPHSGPHAV